MVKVQIAADRHQSALSRCVTLNANSQSIQIHGFCDANQRAYGAYVYIRTRTEGNTCHTKLLCSKSRVTPLKTISLPRIELSAALLLAKLLKKIEPSFSLVGMQIFLWFDSIIVLNWIASPSRKWSVFVVNRISQIQGITNPSDWYYVKSADNPADILSCGLDTNRFFDVVARTCLFKIK